MQTSKIRDAVLDKARQEAAEILGRAQERARDILAQAEAGRNRQIKAAGDELIARARQEAARIQARADLSASQELTGCKDGVLQAILAQARQDLARLKPDPQHLAMLIDEALLGFEGATNIRLLVAPRDLAAVQALVAKEPHFKAAVSEVRPDDESFGGIMAENESGMVSIDNSYKTRLEMLLPQVVPRLAARFKKGAPA